MGDQHGNQRGKTADANTDWDQEGGSDAEEGVADQSDPDKKVIRILKKCSEK